MASSLFCLDEADFALSDTSKKTDRQGAAPVNRIAPSAVDILDDDNDDWFASVPMPDEANDVDDDNFDAAEVEDPAQTGALSYGATDSVGYSHVRLAPSTVPKKPPQTYSSSSSSFSLSHQAAFQGFQQHDRLNPVAQSTQLPQRVITTQQATPQSQRQQQQQQLSTPQSRRRFPGPAGRLPRLRDAGSGGGTFDAASRILHERAKAAALEAAASQRQQQQQQLSSSSQASSQTSSSCQDDASWSAAVTDLGPSLSRFLRRYGIAQVTDMVASGRLPRNKVPAMLVCVDSLDPSAVDCVASLRDPTGRIQAALHQRVFKELRDRVRPGSALVLRRVTLFSADGRSHYLNITMDNVVRIYDREGVPSLPSTSVSASTSSASVCSLTEADLLRLEAECLRPRSPTRTPQTPRVTPQSVGATAIKRHSHDGGGNLRLEEASVAADLAHKRSRYASVPKNQHQQNQRTPGSRHHHQPASAPLHHQSSVTPPSMSAEEIKLQEAYMELLDDNMDDLLASALDDL